MAMKRSLMIVGLVALAACGPRVPNSAPEAGPGFQRYSDPGSYRVQRDAELQGRAPVGSTPTIPPEQSGAPIAAPGTLSSETTTSEASPDGSGAVVVNNPTISDEQDFDAVAGRETIESDAERLRAQRAAYTQVPTTAVPTRTSSGPNIVAFALSTTHPVGQKVYRRSLIGGQAKFERNCAKYAAPDLAQEAFLQAGGPDRDRLGIDPDGDGYACAWNPAPFRRVAG